MKSRLYFTPIETRLHYLELLLPLLLVDLVHSYPHRLVVNSARHRENHVPPCDLCVVCPSSPPPHPSSHGEKVEKVAVLGAGLMGAGIAQVSAEKGMTVLLKDRQE